jgi:hypothetical protein
MGANYGTLRCLCPIVFGAHAQRQQQTQTDNVSILSEEEMALFSRNMTRLNAELAI